MDDVLMSLRYRDVVEKLVADTIVSERDQKLIRAVFECGYAIGWQDGYDARQKEIEQRMNLLRGLAWTKD